MIRHDFENQTLTVPEIREIVPCLSERDIRRHLKEGRCTRIAMLTYDGRRALSKAGKKSAKSCGSRGWVHG